MHFSTALFLPLYQTSKNRPRISRHLWGIIYARNLSRGVERGESIRGTATWRIATWRGDTWRASLSLRSWGYARATPSLVTWGYSSSLLCRGTKAPRRENHVSGDTHARACRGASHVSWSMLLAYVAATHSYATLAALAPSEGKRSANVNFFCLFQR